MPFWRRKPDSHPMPSWLKIGLLVFIVFAAASSWLNPGQNGQKPNWNIFNADTYVARVLPGYGGMNLKDAREGSGQVAFCGQTVEIKLRALAAANAKAEEMPTFESKTLRLGSGDLPRELQEGIIGMKPGGLRVVAAPGDHAAQRFEVELVSADPALAEPEGAMGLKSLDARVGQLQRVRCGDAVRAHLTLWDAGGKRLYDNPMLPVTPGTNALPVGLEQGIIGMYVGGARTIVIPPHLQGRLDSASQPAENLLNVALPEGQVVVADVELLP